MMTKRLIERCIAKDRVAWGEFVNRFQEVVAKAVKMKLQRFGYAFQLEDVKDLVQNIFLDIWEKNKLEQVRHKERIEGWLAIVSQNAAIDYIRRNSHFINRLRTTIANPEGDEAINLVDLIPSDAADPLEETSTAELRIVLDELIGALPGRERLVITLNLLHEKTQREIAGFLKVPLNTVSTIISRTKAKLRQELEKKGWKDF